VVLDQPPPDKAVAFRILTINFYKKKQVQLEILFNVERKFARNQDPLLLNSTLYL